MAEELALEALIRAMDAWPRLREMDAPGAWVHRVGMNLAASWFRRRAAERRAVRRLGGSVAWEDRDVAAVLAVREAVALLLERQRRCVVLRHYLGYLLDVTACALGLSQEATASLTYRAMQTLRRRLADDDPVTEEARDGT